MKKRLKDEGNETVTSCNGLKMTAVGFKNCNRADFDRKPGAKERCFVNLRRFCVREICRKSKMAPAPA